MRVVGGRLRSRPIAGPKSDGYAADRRPAARGAVQHPDACLWRSGDAARACSTCLPAPARSASRRSRAARPTRCSSTTASRRARCCATTSRRSGLGGVTRIFRRDATKLGPVASARAVHARLPRSALRQGPGREGAGLRARRRLAQAGGAGRGRGSGRRRRSRRRKASRNWSGADTTIRNWCFCGRAQFSAARTAARYRSSFNST